MGNRVYSFNYKDKEKKWWGQRFLYDGEHTYDDGLISWEEYNKLKNGFVNNNLKNIKAVNPNMAQPIDDYLGMSMMERMRQNISSDDAWQKIKNIVNGQEDNTVMSMDIETVGDVGGHVRKPAQYTGITEMGFAFQDFKNGFMSGDARRFTLVDGFNPEQVKAAEDVLKSYGASGWNSLNQNEQWLMRMMSAYGEKSYSETVQLMDIPELGGKFWVLTPEAKEIVGDPTNIDNIKRGIKTWGTLYNNSMDANKNHVSNIEAGIKYMAEILSKNEMGIVSANSAFEASILGDSLRKYGASGEMLMKKSADVVYASTIMGRANGMSSFRMQMEALGHGSDPKAPNSVSGLNIASGINEPEFHHGDIDSYQQILIATGHQFHDGKSFAQATIDANQAATYRTTRKGQSASRNIITDLNYGNQYFFMQRGSLDKNNIDTIITVKDGVEEATQDSSIRGRYYTIDEAGSGWTTFNPMAESGELGQEEKVYVLKMVDAENNNRSVNKGFHNKFEADRWVEQNMIGVQKNKTLSSGEIKRHAELSDIDIGRRKFDSFFNINDISFGKKGEEGGFKELEQYLEMAERSNEAGEFTAEFKEKLGLSANATDDDVLAKYDIKSDYKKTEYKYAMKRVRSEESALRAMVDEIKSGIGPNRNAARTAALKDIHDQYINAIESSPAKYKRVIRDEKTKKVKELFQRSGFTIQDAYSLDVVVGDEVKRVNGSNYDNLVSSLDWAFKGATKEEIIGSIDELLSRTNGTTSLISEGNKKPFIDLKGYLEDIHVPGSSYHNTVFGDLAMAMDTVFFKPVRENSLGPFKYFPSKNNDSINIRFINNLVGDTVELNKETLYAFGDGAGNTIHSVNDMFNQGLGMRKETFKETVRNVIDRVNGVKFVESNRKDAIADMVDSLGYSEKQSNVIFDLFGLNKDRQGQEIIKNYSVTNDAFKDIQYHVILPTEEGKNAYGIFTTRDHANAVEKILLEGSYDTSTRKALEKSFGDNAAVIEFKALHRTKLMDVDHINVARGIIKDANNNPLNVFNGDATAIKGVLGNEIYLTTVSQGALQEKFALPGIESYIKDGKLSGGFLNAGDSLINAYRMRFEKFLEAVNEGRFSSASRLINEALNETMKPWASPNGRRTLQGQILSIGDMLHAFQFDGAGLRETFKNELKLSLEHGLTESPIVKLVEAVGLQSGSLMDELSVYNMDTVLNGSAWKEFYAKNLLITKVNEDQLIKDLIETKSQVFEVMGQDKFSKNILDLMIDQHDILANQNLVFSYGKNKVVYPIKEGLLKVKKLEPFLSQLVAPGHYDDNMTLVNAGQFIDMAGMNPSMRPTFSQILNGMYFNPKELDADLMAKLAETGVKVGSSSQSLMEYALLNNVAGLDIKSPTGVPYTQMERQITAPIKQMSDAELVLKYKELDKQYKKGEGVFNLSTEEGAKYRRAYEIFKAENPSLNEGKVLGSSELLNQYPFTSPDIKKIRRYDLQRASDSDATLRDAFLKELERRERDGKVFEVKDGDDLFTHRYHTYTWEGPDTVLTRQNIEDLLESGETKVLPSGRMVNDVKFMFQQEKSMVHYTYIDDDFVRLSENQLFGTAKEARKYQGLIMDLITGYKEGDTYRPMFIGNLAGFKHGNQIGLDSLYRTIVNEYSKIDGGLSELVGVMNGIKDFEKMSPFIDGSKIILNERDMKGTENAIRALEESLRNGKGVKEANLALFGDKNTKGVLQQMIENNIYYLQMQRTNVNEIMAEKVYLDERMAQGVRLRAYDEFRSQSDEWIDGFSIEDRYLKAMKENAILGNNRSLEFVGSDAKNLSAADELILGTEKSVSQRAIESWMKTHASQEKVIEGMWASIRQYAGVLDYKDVNAYVVNLDDVLDSFKDPKSISLMDIKENIFKIEGKLPEYLENIKGTSGSPKNIYFRFKKPITGASHKVGDNWVKGKTFEGILLPLYDVRRLPNGELNLTDAQKSMARFFNVYNKERKNLSKGKKDLVEAFDNMMKGLQEEFSMYNKNSFLYKTSGRTMIPNSMQLLAQDEMSPIVEEAWKDKRLARGVQKERQIYAKMAKNGIKDQYVRELDEIDAVRKEILGKVADRIEKGEQTKALYQVSDLHMLGIDAKGIEKVNGKIMFGNTHAINAKTMRKMGVNTGVIGYQLFKDIESSKGARKLHWYETNDAYKKYLKDPDGYIKQIEEISERFKERGFSANDTDPGKRLMKQINEFTAKNGFLDVNGNAVKLTEKEIADITRKNRNIVLEEMDLLGRQYLTDVGLVTREVWRPPVFSAQTNARIYLDESVGNGQIRTYTGGLISIQNKLDFDGDTEMASFILDEQGGMLRLYGKSGVLMDNELGLAYKSYMASLPANNKIMARLLRDGEAFKVDMLGDHRIASAKVVEKFGNDAFIGGVKEYMKANNIQGNAQDFADNLTRGQYAKMAYSNEMRKAVSEFSATHSMTTNVDLIRASITARVRKENIGAISTPNYKLRDTLLMIEKAYAVEKDEAGQTLVKEIFADLTGIGSDKILDIAEQKAIDVKHIVDAVNIAETSRWATGMNLLFNNDIDMAKRITKKNEGLWQMMRAVNTSTFKMNEEQQLRAIYDEIINGNRKTFREEVRAGGGTIADLKLQFRSLYESTELKYAKDIQNSILRSRHTFLSGVADSVMALQHMVEHIGNYGGSTMDDMLGFARAYTDSRVIANMQDIYIGMPTTMNQIKNIGFYQMTDVAAIKNNKYRLTFQEIDLKALHSANPEKMEFKHTGNTIETEGTFEEINKWLKSNFVKDEKNMGLESINSYMLVNSPESRNAHIANAHKAQMVNQVNEIINNTGYKDIKGFDVFTNFTKMSQASQKRFGQKEYEYLKKIMGSKEDLQEARNLYKDYEHWKLNTSQGRNSKGSGQDLIRAVNESIANKYHGPDKPISYADEIKAIMKRSEFGMPESIIEDMRIQRLKLGEDFDQIAFNNRINKLNGDIYDIIPSEKHINEVFDGIDKTVEKAEHLKRPDSEIRQIRQIGAFREPALAEAREAVAKNNTDILNDFNIEIFGNKAQAGMITKESQMNFLFGWNDNVQQGNMKVGFGRYIGVEFNQLTQDQVNEILNDVKTTTANNKIHAYAINTTGQKLQGFTATAKNPARYRTAVPFQVQDIAVKYTDKIAEISPETYSSVIEAIKQNGMKHKKLSDSIGGLFNGVDTGKVLKGGAIVAGAMAALGIVNNILHKDSHKSPLSPEFSDDKNDPGFKDGAAHPDVQPRKSRGGGKVYAEPRSSKPLQFKVNAKTKVTLSDQNNARLISMAGGGQANIMVSKDTSTVNDNWLANKFAQLSL